MFTKKLMHDIITFCNNYINNDNIVITITKYSTFLSINFSVWLLYKNSIHTYIGAVNKNIHNEKEFIKCKQEILEELPKLLEQLKEK